MEYSRLSSKGQVTIPKAIREELGLEPGDLVAYVVRDRGVRLERVDPFDAEYHRAISDTLQEWSSPEDDEAFNDL